jgi:hypothetical protein
MKRSWCRHAALHRALRLPLLLLAHFPLSALCTYRQCARRLLFAAVSGRVLGVYDQWRASLLKYFSKPPKNYSLTTASCCFSSSFAQLHPSTSTRDPLPLPNHLRPMRPLSTPRSNQFTLEQRKNEKKKRMGITNAGPIV